MLTPTRSIALTCDEIIAITDRVRNEDCGTGEMSIQAFELLRKLGGSYIEAVDVKIRNLTRDIPIDFTESELWLLRSRVNSMEKSATDPLWGVKLLVKLYTALIAFGSPVADLPDGEQAAEPTRAQVQQALREWQTHEEEQHGAESDPDDADHGTTDGTASPTGAGEDLSGAEDKDRGANPKGAESVDATS